LGNPYRFSKNFIISRDNPKTAHILAQIKQKKKKEPLKDIWSRFYGEAAQVLIISNAM